MKDKAFSFYTGVFLISGMVMALQIMQSRIFSVTSWYHLSFLVISIAMFGLTLGALKIYRSDEKKLRENYNVVARKHMVAFAFFILIGLLAQLYIPLVSEDNLKTLINLPLVAIATSAAYYHAGVVITTCLTRSPYPIGIVYGIDLLGAGLGCIFVLVLMETIDTPSGIILLSAVAFLGALCFKVPDTEEARTIRLGDKNLRVKTLAISFAAVVFCIGAANIIMPKPFLYTIFVKDKVVKQNSIAYEEWNSISRIVVGHKAVDQKPFLWGPSPILPEEYKTTYRALNIDGDAGTPITEFDGDFTKHKYLEYDVTNIAYSLPDLKKAAIIGVGGGRDLLSAKYFGLDEVWAMDVNPVQIKLLRDNPEYVNFTRLRDLPGVTLLNQEARSWFRQNEEKLDIIQMSLIDTWAATGAGAFALSENGLYTVEAWTIFMNDLSENGVYTVSRWASNKKGEFVRTVSVAMAALFDQGVENARDHIAVIHSKLISTLIVSKSPLTDEQIAAIKKTSAEKQFEIVMLPGEPLESEHLKTIADAKNLDELLEISSKQYLDISPSTDMRPFFFNQARITKPLEILSLALKNDSYVDVVANGQAKATLNLFIIILFSIAMVAFVIIYPLLKTIEGKPGRFIKAGSLYFILIGLGFMLIEISFLQALGVFLGHPIYGLSIVLFSLILSAGVGSLISDKFPLNTVGKQITWSLLTCAYGIVIAFTMSDIFDSFAEVELFTRALISILMIFPAGILMGFGFPTGLTLTEKFDTKATSWFWGINGAAGIMGSTIGIALNIAIGIDNTLIIGSICYALLTICFIGLSKPEDIKNDEPHATAPHSA